LGPVVSDDENEELQIRLQFSRAIFTTLHDGPIS